MLIFHVNLHIPLRHCFRDHGWRGEDGQEAERERSWSSSVCDKAFQRRVLVKKQLSILWTVKERLENLCLDKRSKKEDQWVCEVTYVAWGEMEKNSTHFQVTHWAVKGAEPRAVGVCSEDEFSVNEEFSQRRYEIEFNWKVQMSNM